MGLNGADDVFDGVPAVDVRRNQLEFNAPIGGDDLLVGFAGLIVQNLQVHNQLAILQSLHGIIVGY